MRSPPGGFDEQLRPRATNRPPKRGTPLRRDVPHPSVDEEHPPPHRDPNTNGYWKKNVSVITFILILRLEQPWSSHCGQGGQEVGGHEGVPQATPLSRAVDRRHESFATQLLLFFKWTVFGLIRSA